MGRVVLRNTVTTSYGDSELHYQLENASTEGYIVTGNSLVTRCGMASGPSRQQVPQALGRVDDPELDRDLVNLGMIEDVVVQDGRVSVAAEGRPETI